MTSHVYLSQHKKQLRQQLKQQLSQLSTHQVAAMSHDIADQVLCLPAIIQADSFFCYVSCQKEVNTHRLITHLLQQNKIVAVPKLIDNAMQAVAIHDLTTLQAGQFGILEPVQSQPLLDAPQVTIAPGLAFSKNGRRLGLGGGHYDRYFAQHPSTLKIALAYSFQVLSVIPFEKDFDRMVDLIVTEQEVIVCSN